MVAIVDYGVGNLFSLQSSFAAIGETAVITGDAEALLSADRVVLPGVGAFEDAANKLRESGLDAVVRQIAQKGTPLMGICLGMQMLFDTSYEFGCWQGLGLIPGEIRPIAEVIPKGYKIPHIGWNALRYQGEKHPLFKYLGEGEHVYFVHSFYATDCQDSVIADTEYGAYLTAAVARGNVMGCQFHPEKSGRAGLSILKAFCEMGGGKQ